MNKTRKLFARAAAVLLSLALLIGVLPSIPLQTAAAEGNLTVGVMNDLHYFPQSLMGSDVNAFIEASKLNSTTSYLADAILENALYEYGEMAKTQGLKYVFIPGDLTKNGEYEGHRQLAARLEQFEKETGVQVLVINGNHDIRREESAQFQNGQFVPTRTTEPEEFRELYANLGYDLADAFFTPPEGETAGMLSYAATLEGGYRVIVLDGACYSSDIHSEGLNVAETRGAYSDALMEWALDQIADAKAQGLTPIGITHFNLVEHFENEDNLFTAFTIDNWMQVAERFADAGMHFAFTGHIHMTDIASHTSDNGETLTDCSSASLLNYPCYFRVVTMDNTAGAENVTMNFQSYDIDRTRPVTAFGTTYPQPFKNTAFALNFGGGDMTTFATNYVRYLLEYTLIPEMEAAGGLYWYLNNALDLDGALDSLLSSASGLGALQDVPKVTLKMVIKNVCDQVERTYLDGGKGTEHLLDVVHDAVDKLVSIEISDEKCTKFLDTLGIGSTTRNGNFGDAVSSCLAYMYSGDEDRSDDPFMNDVIDRFSRGDNVDVILDTLIDIVLHDLLEDEILQNIHLDLVGILGSLSDVEAEAMLGDVIEQILGALGEEGLTDAVPAPSLAQIINLFFAAGLVEYNSLEDVLQSLMDEYLTQSQMDTIANEFMVFLTDFTTDTNPGLRMDNAATITYAGAVPVTPTVEDLRLPSGIAVTFGSDSATTRNISWYTKYSVTGTDIEIVPYSENPRFTGRPTTGSHIETSTVEVTREVPGVDLGVIAIISYPFEVNRHMVEVSGLKPGKKYCFRVGDASRGWWSDVGTFEMADNSDSFTFFHMSDTQSGTPKQYETFAEVADTAFALYPDAKFIMHTGDVVDSGKNFEQWNWLFNAASDTLLNTVMMPATGNHEEDMDNATVENFLLTDYPQQDTTNGVYYSFDYNNAHFMVLNTNDLNSDNTLGTKQLEWLKADAAASDKTWKIVALHKAVYSNGSHYDDDDVTALRKQLSTLMPQLDIDVVLQGHDHVYLRTSAMNDNAVCEIVERTVTHDGTTYTAMVNPDGTVYAIDGCAGVKYYQTKDAALTDQLFPRAEAIVDAKAPVFAAIEIDGENLFFNAYTVENGEAQKIDSFAITKATASELPGTTPGSETPITDANVPKTAGQQVTSALLFLIPVAATVALTGSAIKRKRNEEL